MSTRQQRRVRERRQQQRQPGRGGQPPRGSRAGRYSGGGRGGFGGLNIWTIVLGIAVVLVIVAAIVFSATNKSSSGSATPTIGAEDLATTVDGVHCNSGEQLVYHIHQHLMLYDQGKNIPLPSSIGIPGTEANPTCLYWIHVHQLYPGIIHVESPSAKIWSLGNFIALWKSTKSSAIPQSGNKFLSDLDAAPANQITAFYNGKKWTKSYQAIPLTSHAVIQIDIGTPVVPPKPFTKWGTL